MKSLIKNRLMLLVMSAGMALWPLPSIQCGPNANAQDEGEFNDLLADLVDLDDADLNKSRGRAEEKDDDLEALLAEVPGKALGLAKKVRRGGSSSGVARGDFNGDGFADLAVGIPSKDTPAAEPGSGAVIVIYGSANGLAAPTVAGDIPQSQFWSQNTTGVPGTSTSNDRFGFSLAAGDFNGDEVSDLAIGIPGEDIGDYDNIGAVIVLYGAEGIGLRATGSQFFDMLNDVGEENVLGDESVGSALAWGDFNGDGIGDLAIGAPGFNVTPVGAFTSDAGLVWVLFGNPETGLSTAGNQFLTQGSGGLQDQAETNDRFGGTLAAGDFDADGHSDLVVGIPNEDVAGVVDAGAVQVIFGGEDGLTSDDAFFDQEEFFPDAPGLPSRDDDFGAALAIGDFNGDGHSDIAVGAPTRDIRGIQDAGAVFIRFGSQVGQGLSGGSQFWEQDTIFPDSEPIFGSVTEPGDNFGWALAAGDFNADGRSDLAIGAPFENVFADRGTFFENISNAGEVDVIYGSDTGLSITGREPQIYHQNTINIEDSAEVNDLFGFSLSAWNFGRNDFRDLQIPGGGVIRVPVRYADLAIGVPFENVGPVQDAGAINVIYGSASGLIFSNDQFWTQDSPGIPGASVAGDGFGSTLY